MRGDKGKCPGCDGTGTVAEPCPERGCQKRELHFISKAQWQRAHPKNGGGPDPVIGQMVGDFLVVDLIGAGGFGKVYLAYQSPLLRLKGALKLIDLATDDPEFSQALLKKFQGEAEVLAHLTHPNIVRLLKYGTHAQRPYLVMEYVDGGRTLRDEIYNRTRDERGFGPDEILHILGQVINGLAAAHEESIIHRDIKPENIMLQSVVGNAHHTRLLDFGLAKFVEHHTDTKWHLGSPNYMAPEQISRKNLGPWTDLYAVTVIAFELLSGRRPFPGATENEVLVNKVKDDFDPLGEIADLNFPKPALEFLATGLERDPADRFRNVEAFRTALTPAVESLADRLGPTGATLDAATARLDSDDLLEVVDASSDNPTPAPTEESSDTVRAPSDNYPPKAAPTETTKKAAGVNYPPPEQDVADEPAPEAQEPDEIDEPDEPKSKNRVAFFALSAIVVAMGIFGGAIAFTDFDSPFGPSTDELSADEAELAAVTPPPADAGAPGASSASDAIPSVDAGTDLQRDADPEADNADTGDTEDLAVVEEDRKVLDMALGKFHTCILLREGDVRCWGSNAEGELGQGHRNQIGDTEPAHTAAFIELGEPAVALAAAGDYNASFSCALLESGDLRCWGSNHFGQLGLGSDVRRIGDDKKPLDYDPVDVGGPVAQITAGAMQYASHACALLESGDLRCWGNNRYGQLGLGHTHHIGKNEVPANVNAIDVGADILAVEADKFHTCALLEGGALRCWGRNNTGQLGLGHTDNIGDDEHPADTDPIDVGGPVEQVSVGRGHTCAVLDEGRARCWGWNDHGQLGYGHTDNVGERDTPADAGDIDVGGPVEYIGAGGLHTCALLEEGRVRCWGDNRFGQLGYGHRRSIGADDTPASANDVHLGAPAISLEVSNYHNCALLEDETLRCWGFNQFGQLGYGHTDHIGPSEAPAAAGPVPAF